jgi:hypothetical protein
MIIEKYAKMVVSLSSKAEFEFPRASDTGGVARLIE